MATESAPSPRPLATLEFQKEFDRVRPAIRDYLWGQLKEYPVTLDKFDKMVDVLAGIVSRHYREGAYHGDIDAKGR